MKKSPCVFRRWKGRGENKISGGHEDADDDDDNDEGQEEARQQRSRLQVPSASSSSSSRRGSVVDAAKETVLLTTMAAVASPSTTMAAAARAASPTSEGGGGGGGGDRQHADKDAAHYHWTNTFSGKLSDVGQLTVHLVGASGLRGADFGGKSDPFCTVALGDVEFRSEVVNRTVDPSWNESFHFPVGDMSEMLRVSVLDRDRFHDPEFLGRVDIPLMAVARGQAEEDSHGERVFALKDRKLAGRAAGRHPQIRLRFELHWNVPRGCVRTILPPSPREPPPFKRSMLVGNVRRVRRLLNIASKCGAHIQSCFSWEHPWRSARAFVLFELFAYFIEPYMLPLMVLFLMLVVYPLYEADIVNDWLDPYYELTKDEDDDDDDREDDRGGEDKKGVAGSFRYKAITEVLAFVQNSLGQLASTVERAKNVLTFGDPFMSWLATAFLVFAAALLYLIPVRALLMLWGVNKFSKKLLRPDHVPSSELFNFLSRVPDDPTLSRCKPLSVMDEDLLREEEERKGGGGGAGGGGGGGDTLTAGKLAKKVSSFFAGGGSKQGDSSKEGSEERAVSSSSTSSSSSTKKSGFFIQKDMVKEKVKERAREPPALFQHPPRLPGFFSRGSKDKGSSSSSIPERVQHEAEEENGEGSRGGEVASSSVMATTTTTMSREESISPSSSSFVAVEEVTTVFSSASSSSSSSATVDRRSSGGHSGTAKGGKQASAEASPTSTTPTAPAAAAAVSAAAVSAAPHTITQAIFSVNAAAASPVAASVVSQGEIRPRPPRPPPPVFDSSKRDQ